MGNYERLKKIRKSEKWRRKWVEKNWEAMWKYWENFRNIDDAWGKDFLVCFRNFFRFSNFFFMGNFKILKTIGENLTSVEKY